MSRVWCLVSLLWVVLCGACGGAPSASLEPPWQPAPSDDAVVVAVEPPKPVPGEAWGRRVSQGTVVVHTDPGELPLLRIAGDEKRELPLEHTAVKAHLSGFVATVEVAQTFKNPSTSPIEVIYVFPLPENSAVGAMEMRIGKRVVRAEIQERGEARRTYRRAKRRGHTAALLEQERPNVFTQSVANIAPGESIDVVLRYVQDLTYDAGSYEFVFPMVVGPRFIPGTPLDAAMRGSGTYQDTDRVPDASRITPPVLGKGERSGHDISIELLADNALPIRRWEAPTHDVETRASEDGTLRMRLASGDRVPNRDFVLRYQVAGREPRATLLTSGEARDGHFALMVHPPELDVDQLVGQRELIFVLDVSGSMRGTPLGMCKRAMRKALSKLRPVDTFNIITFAGASRSAFASPRPANRTSLDAALRFVGKARAGGGTHMAAGVRAALSPSVARGRHRYVFFLTDGYVGNEDEIIEGSEQLVEALAGRGQRARVFGFGVGSSVNRHLLEGLSEAGNGVAVYATNREDPARGVNRFFHYIDRPVLTDLRIRWADAETSELYPQPLPDLFASHPVIVHGRYSRLSEAPAMVQARLGEREVAIPVVHRQVMASSWKGGLVGRLWARSKVAHLEEESWLGMVQDAPERIARLGLDYELVTPYTSFVAVDRSRVVGNGQPNQVVQPVETPEGVDATSAGARRATPKNSLAPIAQGMPTTPTPVAPVPDSVPGLDAALSGGDKGWAATEEGDDDDDDDADEAEAKMEPQDEPSPEPSLGYAPGPPEADMSARGCGCRVAGTERRTAPWAGLLALLGLVVLRRRRR